MFCVLNPPLVAELQLRSQLGMAGAEFRQLPLQPIIGFIQYPVVLCLLLLIQREGVIELGTDGHQKSFKNSIPNSTFTFI